MSVLESGIWTSLNGELWCVSTTGDRKEDNHLGGFFTEKSCKCMQTNASNNCCSPLVQIGTFYLIIIFINQVSGVMCQVSSVRCHMSH